MTKKTWSNLDLSESFEVALRELDRNLSKNTRNTEFDKGYFKGISLAKTIINCLQEKNNA